MAETTTDSAVVYFIQSRERWRGEHHWSQWTCVSPLYATCRDARPCFRVRCQHNYLPTQVRLVRAVFAWERVPLQHHDLFASAGSGIRVIARHDTAVEASR